MEGLWYDVGKVARLLSCKGLGARKRVYGHLASTQPTVSMRVDKLKLPGKEGGCAAVEIAMEDVLAGVQREGIQQPGDEGDRMAALDDLKGFLKAVLKLRNHKAFPPGSVPAELLKAVLFPSWLHRDRSKPGVGAPTMQATLSKLSSSPVRNCVMKIFRVIRATQRSPVMWHSAQAAYVSKHNGKAWSRDGHVSFWTGVSSKRSAEGPGRAATRILPVDFWQHPRTKTRRGNSAPTRDILAPAESGHFARDADA